MSWVSNDIRLGSNWWQQWAYPEISQCWHSVINNLISVNRQNNCNLISYLTIWDDPFQINNGLSGYIGLWVELTCRDFWFWSLHIQRELACIVCKPYKIKDSLTTLILWSLFVSRCDKYSTRCYQVNNRTSGRQILIIIPFGSGQFVKLVTVYAAYSDTDS